MAFVGNTPATQSFVPTVDFFNGNGSTTAFTLSRTVGSNYSVAAFVSNVSQTPGTAFTISGNTITFASAPPSGTNNIYVYYVSPIAQIIAPSQGTVSQSTLGTVNFYLSPQSMVGSYTLPTGYSAVAAGPMNISPGSTVTIPPGGRIVIV